LAFNVLGKRSAVDRQTYKVHKLYPLTINSLSCCAKQQALNPMMFY